MGRSLTNVPADSTVPRAASDGFRPWTRIQVAFRPLFEGEAARSLLGALSRVRSRAHRPYTAFPATHVEATRVAPIWSTGPANGSRSRTARSAACPGARTPAPSSRSRPLTQAEPEVYAAKAVVRSIACSGRNGSRGSSYDVRVTAVWIAAIGSGEVTGQSLPITRRAPARRREPKGYCQVDRSWPRNGIVSSSI